MQTEKFAWHRPWFNLETGRKRTPFPGEREAERDRLATLLVGKVCRYRVNVHEDNLFPVQEEWSGAATVEAVNTLYADELEVIFSRPAGLGGDGRRLHMMEIEYIVSPD